MPPPRDPSISPGQTLPPPDLSKPIVLLPLLQPPSSAPHATQPPLSQLPLGRPTPPRLPFRSTKLTGAELASTAADIASASDDEWVATTHLFPAAYPRSSPSSTTPLAPGPSVHDAVVPHPPGVSAAELKAHERKQREIDLAKWDEIHARVPPLDALYPPHTEDEAQTRAKDIVGEGKAPQLWGCVQRIRRKGGKPEGKKGTGLTLVYAHANGFHKEIYEPAIKALLEALDKSSSDQTWVEEVWNLDSVNSGEAGVLNRASLGEEVAWTDAPRDILQLLRHYIPDSISSPLDLGSVLPRRNDDGTRRSGRRFVGVGHSFSGAAMSLLATCEPELFEGLFVLDPVMGLPLEEWFQPVPSQVPMARSAIARQSYWPSRLSASSYLSSRPFFSVWHLSVLALHVAFAFRPLDASNPAGECTLATTKWSEALAFANSWMGRFALQNVRLVGRAYRGRVHVITMRETTIYGPLEGGFAKDVRETFKRTMGKEGRRGSEEEMLGGHLVAQEQPELLGRKMAEKLEEWFDGAGTGSERARL